MSGLRKYFPSSTQRQTVEQLIKKSPSPALAETNLSRLLDNSSAKLLKQIPAADLPALIGLLGASAFLSEVLIREGANWPELFQRQIKIKQKTTSVHAKELNTAVKGSRSFADFCAALRRHKQREFLRIGARDLMAAVTMEETVHELTALADASLDAAYRFCRAEVEKDYGALNLPGTKKPNRFVVIGMGKLGGRELNFSSDVDVIFLHENDEGETSGGRKGKVGAREFFSAIGQKIIQAMGDVTEDGFVFRIDLRLRPLGANGPLVQSVDSAMLYYESWGQCWERAAMIKARPAAGAIELGAEFLKEIEPFIYRRYLDYGVFEGLRQLHQKVRDEAQRRAAGRPERSNDVKLSRGGIREIEFIVQLLLVVRGGQFPEMRTRSTLKALDKLGAAGLMKASNAKQLGAAYTFLRRVEHRIQYLDDQQTHLLPTQDADLTWIARSMGLTCDAQAGELLDRLGEIREFVATEFDALLHDGRAPPGGASATNGAQSTANGSAGCRGCGSEPLGVDSEAFAEQLPQDLAARVRSLRDRPKVAMLRDASKLRLARLIESAAAATLFFASYNGIPVSTTHTITGAIVGVGAAQSASAVRWGVAGNILWAWILTIPCSAFIAGVAWYIGRLLLAP